jgi:hypothetical protein
MRFRSFNKKTKFLKQRSKSLMISQASKNSTSAAISQIQTAPTLSIKILLIVKKKIIPQLASLALLQLVKNHVIMVGICHQ